MKFKAKRLLYLLIPLFSHIVYEILYRFPEFTEKYYSQGIYPFLTKLFGFFTKYLPFSLAEFLLYAFAIFIVYILIKSVYVLIRHKEGFISSFFGNIELLAIVSGIIYSVFVLCWSINFSRVPLVKSLGYNKELYTKEELASLTKKLAIRSNELREIANEDENGCFCLSANRKEVMKKAVIIYEANKNEFLHKCISSKIKHNTIPDLLSVYNIQGIYSPFTFEANVNIDMPDLYFPASCCHEYSHLQGFSKEDEAEFISFLVSYNCGDNDFMYSAMVTALTHALNALRGADYNAYREICYLLSDDIYKDFELHNNYWEKFEGKIEEVSETLNDNYLKSNHQKSGIKSYGMMLDTLLAMDKAGRLNL